MINEVFSISVIAAFVGDVLVFVFSLLFCFRSWNPSFLRSFPIYCFVTMVADGLFLFIPEGPHKDQIHSVIYNVFTVFELIYLSFLLIGLVHSRRVKKITRILSGLLLLYILYKFWRMGMTNGSFAPGAFLMSVLLLVPCLTFYREIVVSPNSPQDLRRDPAFWLVTSFTFELLLFVPTILFTAYFFMANQQQTANLVYSVNNYAGLVSDVLILIAFTCRIKK